LSTVAITDVTTWLYELMYPIQYIILLAKTCTIYLSNWVYYDTPRFNFHSFKEKSSSHNSFGLWAS